MKTRILPLLISCLLACPAMLTAAAPEPVPVAAQKRAQPAPAPRDGAAARPQTQSQTQIEIQALAQELARSEAERQTAPAASSGTSAETAEATEVPAAPGAPVVPDLSPAGKTPEEKLAMLAELIRQKENIGAEIAELQKAIKKSPADSVVHTEQLAALNKQLAEANRDFERVAAGTELAALSPEAKKAFDWKAEVAALVDPLLKELRALTAAARQKTELRETIENLGKQVQTAGQAAANLEALMAAGGEQGVQSALGELLDDWRDEEKRLSGKLELARMDLHNLTDPEAARGKTTAKLHAFLRTRGLYLLMGAVTFTVAFLALRLLFRLLLRRLPVGREGRAGLYGRLISVFSHLFSALFATAAMLVVFFIVGDGFIISLAALLILGTLWALRQALPHHWQRSLFLLNMGTVREGERLLIDGVPWRVDSLGMFCRLSNPVLDQVLRLPVDKMIGLVSRPYNLDEPWFPCKKGDFLRLADGSVVQVKDLSSEQVRLSKVATGAVLVHPTASFIGMAAENISKRFFVNAVLGLSYDLQADITGRIPATLKNWLHERLEAEGYAAKCLSLTCEFGKMSASSLDISVFLEFPGDMAPLYNRLHRALERWCVDCCTENGWEIPFQQVVVHRPAPPMMPQVEWEREDGEEAENPA